MIKKIAKVWTLLFLGVLLGMIANYYMNLSNQYIGAQKLISDCQLELKRTQKCVLIAVEDEPESAVNDANNNN